MVPCEGIFVDVKELPSENVTAEQEELLLERYKNYKKFYEQWRFKSHDEYEIEIYIIITLSNIIQLIQYLYRNLK